MSARPLNAGATKEDVGAKLYLLRSFEALERRGILELRTGGRYIVTDVGREAITAVDPYRQGAPKNCNDRSASCNQASRRGYEMSAEIVTIDYTNWRLERRLRQIIPLSISFGSNEWHKKPQWLMLAIDMETTGEKTFALADIHAWSPTPNEG